MMTQQFKQSFFQVFTITMVWVALLLTVFYRDQSVSLLYMWNVVGIAGISAVLFGIMYNALWNYFTLKPVWNILISSTLNIAGGLAMVWLFSEELFHGIAPWLPGMLVLSVLLHTAAFYFYARYDSKKKTEELNRILK
jgi:FlaA1/EpsC-like NDP-sugar epimerase